MAYKLRALVPVALSALLTIAWAQDAFAAEALPLKRVMLSSGGVGYFEHEAIVDGNAEFELSVRLDQVDDILKSIVVYDDKGAVGAVSLPGREPLAQIFRDMPFPPAALKSPVALLNALIGAEVRVVGTRALEGRLISVVPEVTRLPSQEGTVTRHRVSLMTDKGVQHLIYEEAESLEFMDPALRAQVERALAAIAEHRVRGKRTLRVVIKGAGKRAVRVAYVVGAALWKSTYRLTLSQDAKAENGLLQGWAVLENMSGQDWRDVELTLLSGNPVTFRQALYTAYYVNRPSVPVEVLGRILPRPDTGAVVGKAPRKRAQLKNERLEQNKRAMAKSVAPSAEARAPGQPLFAQMASAPADAEEPFERDALVATSKEAATQVIFKLPGTVTLEAGHSLMVPIVDREVPARRVSLYQPDTHASHPLAAVRLTNNTGSGLPPGVLTLYEGGAGSGNAYVGDARLNTFPVGEERLVSFALDQKVHISRERRDARRISKAAVERGVLRLTVVRKRTTEYRVKAPAQEDRRLLIEVPRSAHWKLVSPDEKEAEITETHYRIERKIGKGEEVTFEVTLQRPLLEKIGIARLSLKRMLAYASSTELSAKVRKAFARMAELRREVSKHQARLKELEARRRVIFQEQDRIRGNLQRIPRGGDLHRRYLDKLNTQENELEDIVGKKEVATKAENKAKEALARFIAELKI